MKKTMSWFLNVVYEEVKILYIWKEKWKWNMVWKNEIWKLRRKTKRQDYVIDEVGQAHPIFSKKVVDKVSWAMWKVIIPPFEGHHFP